MFLFLSRKVKAWPISYKAEDYNENSCIFMESSLQSAELTIIISEHPWGILTGTRLKKEVPDLVWASRCGALNWKFIL